MENMTLQSIGRVDCREGEFCIVLDAPYRRGLEGLEQFGAVQVLWWANECDDEAHRQLLTEEKPYTKGPETLGVFATRAPERPNPIGLSTAFVTFVDAEEGTVGLTYLDAFAGTPVLDIKPYTPSLDRISSDVSPAWCAHWPRSVEESGDFDWEAEFNF